MKRLACLVLLACLAGCDDAPPPVPRVPAARVSGTAVVNGTVYFDGTPPPQKIIRNEPCCPNAPPTLLDEEVVINANGTLANVFVYLDGGPKVDGSALPAAVLDQQFCRYVPHVVGVVVGQELKLRSSDPTTHNVNIRPPAGRQINEYMTHAGDTKTIRLDDAAVGFGVTKCDVHPWMRGVVGVFDNPFFAVTDGRGTFTISGVPDGTYTLKAYHERYQYLSRPLTIKDGRAETHDFRYGPRP